MVDVNKLKGKIVEKGLSVEKVAERIEIDKSTLYRKLNINGETITIKEASKLVELLGLSPLEASAIFFCKKNRIISDTLLCSATLEYQMIWKGE